MLAWDWQEVENRLGVADLLLLERVIAVLDSDLLELLDIVSVDDSVAATSEQLVEGLTAPLDY